MEGDNMICYDIKRGLIVDADAEKLMDEQQRANLIVLKIALECEYKRGYEAARQKFGLDNARRIQ